MLDPGQAGLRAGAVLGQHAGQLGRLLGGRVLAGASGHTVQPAAARVAASVRFFRRSPSGRSRPEAGPHSPGSSAPAQKASGSRSKPSITGSRSSGREPGSSASSTVARQQVEPPADQLDLFLDRGAHPGAALLRAHRHRPAAPAAGRPAPSRGSPAGRRRPRSVSAEVRDSRSETTSALSVRSRDSGGLSMPADSSSTSPRPASSLAAPPSASAPWRTVPGLGAADRTTPAPGSPGGRRRLVFVVLAAGRRLRTALERTAPSSSAAAARVLPPSRISKSAGARPSAFLPLASSTSTKRRTSRGGRAGSSAWSGGASAGRAAGLPKRRAANGAWRPLFVLHVWWLGRWSAGRGAAPRVKQDALPARLELSRREDRKGGPGGAFMPQPPERSLPWGPDLGAASAAAGGTASSSAAWKITVSSSSKTMVSSAGAGGSSRSTRSISWSSSSAKKLRRPAPPGSRRAPGGRGRRTARRRRPARPLRPGRFAAARLPLAERLAGQENGFFDQVAVVVEAAFDFARLVAAGGEAAHPEGFGQLLGEREKAGQVMRGARRLDQEKRCVHGPWRGCTAATHSGAGISGAEPFCSVAGGRKAAFSKKTAWPISSATAPETHARIRFDGGKGPDPVASFQLRQEVAPSPFALHRLVHLRRL